MKKIQIILGVLGMVFASSCSDFLETETPSSVTPDFVFGNEETAAAALDGVYETWRDCANGAVFGDGLFYAADVAGSDIERHPEAFSNQVGRHYPESFYQNGTFAGSYPLGNYDKNDGTNAYSKCFAVIGQSNAIISAMEKASNFSEIVTNATEPSPLSQMYGEVIAMRATAYREMIRYYGDVPYNSVYGVAAEGLTSRDAIYDKCIADLIRVEPLMYPVGKVPSVAAANKNHFSKTYVQGLIGRLALEAAGYQTRMNGFDYVDGEGNKLTFDKLGTDNNGAFYGRRSDWKELYKTAKTYYEKLLADPGTAKWYATDPRGVDKQGRVYDNPYQYFFQQMLDSDAGYADEAIYEYPMQQGTGGNDARGYSYGRPSDGGSKNAYPCKLYGQSRVNPAYYYGVFDPADKRRDVCFVVTGHDGKGAEKMISFKMGSKTSGGISLNKWDEGRMATPWVAAQRKSGINGPYMRMAEIYLSYAEVCAQLGDEGTARNYLKQVRERSFPAGKANTEKFISDCGSLFKAIIEERGFEFAGDGDRRWTLIRTGLLPENIKRIKDMTRAMIDGLKANGVYTFPNGNQISSYIYTKSVDAKSQYGYRLTTQCPEDKQDDPVLFPGWRGENDDWAKYGASEVSGGKTNLAIKGLFKALTDSEVAALDGYSKVSWGKDIVDNEDEYLKYLFYDYDYQKAPIYLWPFTPNILSTMNIQNGYGFPQK